MNLKRSRRVAAEFLLIVVGVLAALAVDQARSWRGERVQERLYLEGLSEDLERSAVNLEEAKTGYVAMADLGHQVLPVLQRDEPVPEDSIAFLIAVFDATRIFEPVLVDATYTDLLSTGALQLLRNRELRRAVVDYYSSINEQVSPTDLAADRAAYRAAVRSSIPPEVQFAIRGCPNFREELQSRISACRASFVGLPIRRAVVSLLDRESLASDLTLAMSSRYRTNRIEVALGMTSDLKGVVERELGGM